MEVGKVGVAGSPELETKMSTSAVSECNGAQDGERIGESEALKYSKRIFNLKVLHSGIFIYFISQFLFSAHH